VAPIADVAAEAAFVIEQNVYFNYQGIAQPLAGLHTRRRHR
jgi:hypothetical protein